MDIQFPHAAAAPAAKSLQSCPTLCDPIDCSPPDSPVLGILQAGALEWVAISFSNAWKWSRSVMSNPQRPHGLQPTRLLCPWDFPGKSTGVGCHCLLWVSPYSFFKRLILPISTLVEDNLTVCAWLCFWALYSVPLDFVSVFMAVYTVLNVRTYFQTIHLVRD